MTEPAWSKSLRRGLAGLLAVGAMSAFAGGYYGLAGARAVPREWLEGTAFSSYFIPGLVLYFVVGGTLLVASFAVLVGAGADRVLAAAAGTVLLAWIAAQFTVIGFHSWIEPVPAVVGVLILILAPLLPRTARSARG